jgi:ABC-type glycerol-3-phosphate transport system substrate-binding protein
MAQFVLPQKFSTRQIVIVVGIVVLLAMLYFGVSSNLRRDTQPPEVRLTVWGPFDEGHAFQAVSDDYKKIRGNVTLVYRPIPEANYYETLLEALAAGSGPDIFMIDNRSLPQQISKLAPLFENYIYPTMREPLGFGLLQFRDTFPRVAENDFVWQGYIMAVPLWVDTLALIYSKDALDQAGLQDKIQKF